MVLALIAFLTLAVYLTVTFGDIGHNRLDRLIGPWKLDWIDKIDRIETGMKSEE